MAVTTQLEFVIRQYAPQDEQSVKKVFLKGSEIYRDIIPPEIWSNLVQESLNTDLPRIPSTYIALGGNFWVVTTSDKSKIVGIVGLENKGDGVGELRRMVILSEVCRRGLGRKLVAEVETWAKANGFTKIFLLNSGPKEDARAFYRAVGYQDVGKEVVSVEPYMKVFQLAKQL